MTNKLEQHPLVVKAQQAIDGAAKAVVACERERETIQRELDQNMANQIQAFTAGGDPSNPLNKGRKPTSFGKLTENLHTAEAKQAAATAAVQQLEAKLASARLKARGQVLADYHKQYQQGLNQLDKALDKAPKPNERVLDTYQPAQADLGVTTQIENYSWSEFNHAPAGNDTKLTCWKRSVDDYYGYTKTGKESNTV
jgi:predicted  nucleic acid-binding Zn-ribbon protein